MIKRRDSILTLTGAWKIKPLQTRARTSLSICCIKTGIYFCPRGWRHVLARSCRRLSSESFLVSCWLVHRRLELGKEFVAKAYSIECFASSETFQRVRVCYIIFKSSTDIETCKFLDQAMTSSGKRNRASSCSEYVAWSNTPCTYKWINLYIYKKSLRR